MEHLRTCLHGGDTIQITRPLLLEECLRKLPLLFADARADSLLLDMLLDKY